MPTALRRSHPQTLPGVVFVVTLTVILTAALYLVIGVIELADSTGVTDAFSSGARVR
jgi:hypothetical protein